MGADNHGESNTACNGEWINDCPWPVCACSVKMLKEKLESIKDVVNDAEREEVAKILRDNITFSGQVGDYIIHGAIDKLIEWKYKK